MSSVTIKTDSKILANSIAIWFESGNAMTAFIDSQEGETALSLEPEIANYTADVEFGDGFDVVDHEVTLLD